MNDGGQQAEDDADDRGRRLRCASGASDSLDVAAHDNRADALAADQNRLRTVTRLVHQLLAGRRRRRRAVPVAGGAETT